MKLSRLILNLVSVILAISATQIPAVGQTPNLSNWTRIDGPFGGVGIQNFLIDSSHQIFAFSTRRVFYSYDAGISWHQVSKFAYTISRAFFAPDSSLYLLDSYGTILRTTNNCETWDTVIARRKQYKSWLDFTITKSGSFLATVSAASLGSILVYRSTNKGKTWEESGAMSYGNTNFHCFQEKILLFSNNLLYISTDDGLSWNRMRDVSFSTDMISDGKGTYYALGSKGPNALLVSKDTGSTWSAFPYYLYPSPPALIFDTTGVLLSAWTSGVYKTDIPSREGDSLEWQKLTSEDFTYKVGYLNTLFKTPSGSYLIGSEHSLFRSTNNGSTWELSEEGITSPAITGVLVTKSGVIVVGTEQGGIYSKKYKDDSWNRFIDASSDDYITSRRSFDVIETYTGDLLNATEMGIYRSRDSGKTWLPVGPRKTKIVYLVAGNDSVAMAGMQVNGRSYLRTPDNWITWDSIDLSKISDMKFNPRSGTFFALRNFTSETKDGYYESTDSGRSWKRQVTSGSRYYNTDMFIDTTTGYLFFAKNYGDPLITNLSISRDTGKMWQNVALPGQYQITNILTTRSNRHYATTTKGDILQIDCDSTNCRAYLAGDSVQPFISLQLLPDGRVLAATRDDGLFITVDTVVLSIREEKKQHLLASAKIIPNPLTQNTLRLSGITEPVASICVIDILGRVVFYTEDMLGNLDQTVALNVDFLSSGYYYVQVLFLSNSTLTIPFRVVQ